MTVAELLSGPEKWTQGTYARDRYGNGVPINSPEAVCWCFTAALVLCRVSWPHTKAHLIAPYPCLALWNDAPERTFEEVRDLVEKAGI